MTRAPTADEIRAEVGAWLRDRWDPSFELRAWRQRLLDDRWLVPSWPERWYGRGLPDWADAVVRDQLTAVGAPGPPMGVGMSLAAPTMLAHASDDVKRRFLPPTLIGAETWTQLFSEPGAGSDLAGLATTAVQDGDEWVVNGQKVWNTSAHHADHGLLLARTDWNVPKHAGITCFVVAMHQPGVEVRPLRQMNGHTSFNEVFLTDARIPVDHVIGDVGDGWRVARTTLAHERGFATMRPPRHDAPPGRATREAAAEAAEHLKTYEWYPQRAGRPDLIIEAARQAGQTDDPLTRQKIAVVLTLQRVHEWTARRAMAARAAGRPPGPEGSLGKLAASVVARASADVHTTLAGPFGTIVDGDELRATVAEVLVSTPAQSIVGGTDEIQRNIIGERVLGLPSEPHTDREVPFREVPRTGEAPAPPSE